MDGIESVRKNSQVDAQYERKVATNGQRYFSLKATSGQSLGKSEMYGGGNAAMENGIASVKKKRAGRQGGRPNRRPSLTRLTAILGRCHGRAPLPRRPDLPVCERGKVGRNIAVLVTWKFGRRGSNALPSSS